MLAHYMEPPGGWVDSFEYRDVMRASFAIGDETVDEALARHKLRHEGKTPARKGQPPSVHRKPSQKQVDRMKAMLARGKPREKPAGK